MEQLNFYLYFCFVLLRPVSLHPEEEHLVMSDLTPYNSLHGPEQIHIAYGDSPSEMTILWSTSNSTELASSIVLYGLAPKNYSSKAEGKFVLFTEGNPDGLKYIHRVVLQVRRKIIKLMLFEYAGYVILLGLFSIKILQTQAVQSMILIRSKYVFINSFNYPELS